MDDRNKEIKERLFDMVFAGSCIIYAICCIASIVLAVFNPALFWGPLAIAVISMIGSLIFLIVQKTTDKEERERRRLERKLKKQAKERNKII